jgi:hypothetical protein
MTMTTTNVLLVGEMDLSFAMDLSQHLRPGRHHLCATTYFDEESMAKRIRGLFRNSARVLRKRGVDVQTNVDATRLDDPANLNRAVVVVGAAAATTATRAGGDGDGGGGGGGGGGSSGGKNGSNGAGGSGADTGGDNGASGDSSKSGAGCGGVGGGGDGAAPLRQFDTIAFCFPRGSDISGVRVENDDLLSGLFKSATHVLRPGGCVGDDGLRCLLRPCCCVRAALSRSVVGVGCAFAVRAIEEARTCEHAVTGARPLPCTRVDPLAGTANTTTTGADDDD